MTPIAVFPPLDLLVCPDTSLNALVAATEYTLSPVEAAEAFDVILMLQQQRKFTPLDVVVGFAEIPVLEHFAAEVRPVTLPELEPD